MTEHLAVLSVQVTVGPDSDADETAQATLQLRRELLDLDVDAVDAVKDGDAPPGSRAVEVAALGALVVKLAGPHLLSPVLATVRSWLAASSRRTIKLKLGDDELVLTGVSSSDQLRLANEWLARQMSQ